MKTGTVGVMVGAIWLLSLAAFGHVAYTHARDPEANPVVIVGAVAALIALAGWTVQAWVALRNSRKQHTMNVLFQTRMSTVFREEVARISAAFPGDTAIPYAALLRPENRKILAAVRFVLNYYEFIAVGIQHGDLDERMLRDCIRTQLCIFCRRTEDVFVHVRGENAKGRPAPDKAQVLRHLRRLHRRWRKTLAPPDPRRASAPPHDSAPEI